MDVGRLPTIWAGQGAQVLTPSKGCSVSCSGNSVALVGKRHHLWLHQMASKGIRRLGAGCVGLEVAHFRKRCDQLVV